MPLPLNALRLLLLLLCWGSSLVLAGSPVWKLEGRAVPFYMAGTIHVLRDADYPLPDELEQAFANSRVLVMEIGLSPDTQRVFAQRMLEKGLYPAGDSLQAHIQADTLARIEALAHERGWPLETLLQHKPWLLGLNLMQLEFQHLGVLADNGVDLHFYRKAVAAGKPVVALETADEQLDALMAMGDIPADELLGHFLNDVNDLPGMLNRLVPAWKAGDYATIDAEMSREMRETQPALYQSLLVDRNRRWLPKLEALMAGGDPVLVLVGSVHLAGPDSLLAMLAERGYHFHPVADEVTP